MNDFNESNISKPIFYLELLRQPIDLLIIYCVAYGLVFTVGFVGNSFVVLAVACNSSMRNITNYFITSLAAADLLIIIFCLPATLMNNILQEWLLGNLLCKVSVWVNGATSCSSVYTLVAVTADRYFAICHTMRYNIVEKEKAWFVIIPIWIVSGSLFVPYLVYFKELIYNPPNTTLEARICYPTFPSPESERFYFLVVNCLVSFFIPLAAIIVLYAYIFLAIFRHSSMAVAVDHRAHQRESRIRMRVTHMMLTVVIIFAASWLPLYCLFTYFHFGQPRMESPFGHVAYTILRPIFQWLSLANSCINPILYSIYSNKFRTAFQQIMVLPLRRRYQRVKQYARSSMKSYTGRFDDSTKRSRMRTTGTSSGTIDTTVLDSPCRDGRPRIRIFCRKKQPELSTADSPSGDSSTKSKHSNGGGKKVRVHNQDPNSLGMEICDSIPTSPSIDPLSREEMSGNLMLYVDNPEMNSLSPVAPVITMRDLDVFSMSPRSPRPDPNQSAAGKNQNGDSILSNNSGAVTITQQIGSQNNCPLRFIYVKEVSKV